MIPPKRILIVRLSAIGDIVMASGLIPALKKRFPNAQISWLAEPATASLLKETPELHDVIVWQRADWQALFKAKRYWTLLKAVLAFRRTLKSKEFDLVLDAQGLLKSGLLARFSGAKQRIGLGSKEGSQHLMTEVLPKQDDPMISSEYRALARHLGAAESDFVMHLPASDHTQQTARQKLQAVIGEQPYIVFCPYTTRPQKHWFNSHWQQLALQLAQHTPWPCVVLGGSDDQTSATTLCAGQPNLHSLAGQTNLLQTSEVIRHAKLLIGVDTGITHMGIAHRVPTLALFGSTRPYLQTPNHNAEVLYLNKPCSPCKRRPSCDGRFDCLRDISPHMVVSRVQAILAEAG